MHDRKRQDLQGELGFYPVNLAACDHAYHVFPIAIDVGLQDPIEEEMRLANAIANSIEYRDRFIES